MGKTAIVTGGTCKDVAAMGVLAINLREKAPDLADELIIFHDGISKKNQQIIQRIMPTRFEQYSFPIDFISKRKNRSLRYFSEMIFCKYECFRLLREFDRVIWTDYDVLILKDLHELNDRQDGLQIVRDSAPMRQMFLPSVQEVKLDEFDLSEPGVCTPLFVLAKAVGDYEGFYEWCITMTQKYAAYIDLPEQCIMSMLIQKYQIPYYNLSGKQYALHPREYDGEASILHSYGRPKFWEGLYNEQWEAYYAEWLSMGGSRYHQPWKEKLINVKSRVWR